MCPLSHRAQKLRITILIGDQVVVAFQTGRSTGIAVVYNQFSFTPGTYIQQQEW